MRGEHFVDNYVLFMITESLWRRLMLLLLKSGAGKLFFPSKRGKEKKEKDSFV
jgi:hypothetical protein